MTLPKTAEPAVPGTAPGTGALSKLPPALRRLLASTPEKEWTKLRVFLVGSPEEGELVEMLPELGRVMKYCPAKLVGRVGRREISGEQLDRAYTQLHDSLHGVREAIHALLHLAGFQDFRPQGEPVPPQAPVRPAEAASPRQAPGVSAKTAIVS